MGFSPDLEQGTAIRVIFSLGAIPLSGRTTPKPTA